MLTARVNTAFVFTPKEMFPAPDRVFTSSDEEHEPSAMPASKMQLDKSNFAFILVQFFSLIVQR
jgi:hypothetical protein